MLPNTTLARFIYSQERKYPDSTGEFSDLLSSIALGVKMISHLVQTAGFRGMYGYTGTENVQGERTRLLDKEADDTLVEILGSSRHFGLLVSEERDGEIAARDQDVDAKYVVAFDPLDGSSNIGTNIPVGTIFAILKKRDEHKPAGPGDFLQTGRSLVAAGYSVYGAKTSFVYSTGQGAHGFTLDPTIGEFVLTEESITCPDRGEYYSVNEGYTNIFDPKVKNYIDLLKSDNKSLGTPYSTRYVGSLVADFDRTIRQGGVFMHPATSKRPRGKLRLLYECMPLAFIAEQAGAMAIDGTQPVLDVMPQSIHERCPLIVASKMEMGWFLK